MNKESVGFVIFLIIAAAIVVAYIFANGGIKI